MMRRVCFFLVFLPILLPAATQASVSEAGPTWTLGVEPRTFTLANGLSVVFQQDGAGPVTAVQVVVRCGDGDDPPGKAGLAFLTARLCLEITEVSILQHLMEMGSGLSFNVGGTHSMFTLRSLSRNLEPTLAVLAAMLKDPLFSDLRIDGVKRLMLSMQEREADDPVLFMRKTAAAAFYREPAYGAARFGDAESIQRIGRKEIQSFFHGRYRTGNMVVVVVSDLSREQIEPMLARYLGRLPAGRGTEPQAVTPRRPPQSEQIIERGTKQTLISFTAPLPELTADHFVLASVMESWLGRGIGSRLWPLRSRGGLAYGLNADVQPNREAMMLNVYLKTEAQQADGARIQLARLLETAGRDGIDAAELATAKTYAKAVFLRENEMREQRAATMAFLEGSGLSWRLAGEFAGRVDRIEIGEFNVFLKNALAPENRFFLRVGPAAR